MEAGKKKTRDLSPVVLAIAEAESQSTGEIRVHISRRRWDPDPLKRAQAIFQRLEMEKTRDRNGVLFYINVRKRVFAVVGDEGIHRVVGQKYWDELCQALRDDLHSTFIENAIALAVRTIGSTLKRFFPLTDEAHRDRVTNPNELSNDVTED